MKKEERPMKIVLDVDGTMAVIDRLILQACGVKPFDLRYYDEITDLLGYERFIETYTQIWTSKHRDIPITDPSIPHVVYSLKNKGHEICIATNRYHLQETIPPLLDWLAMHNIYFDELRITKQQHEKASIGDLLIDDNPHLVSHGNVILFERSYNVSAECRKIKSFHELLSIDVSKETDEKGCDYFASLDF
ncbi:MAG TPA: hypothetical protein ENO30_05950 [Thermodesulfobium narugense]|nr:hypothetical protein [Thermodesulfobium narugense]